LPLVTTDVRTRDYRLIMQSTQVAVFNPWFNGEMSTGIDNEIDCALRQDVPVHIYQDPDHDRPGKVKGFKKSAGPLGEKLTHHYVMVHNSLNDLLNEIVKD